MAKRKGGRKRPNPENFDEGLTRVADDFKPINPNYRKRMFEFGYNQAKYDIKNIISKWYYEYFESSCDCESCKKSNEETLNDLFKQIDKLKLRGERINGKS